jgi:hypothetical protein
MKPKSGLRFVQKWLESGVSDEIRRMIRNQGIGSTGRLAGCPSGQQRPLRARREVGSLAMAVWHCRAVYLVQRSIEMRDHATCNSHNSRQIHLEVGCTGERFASVGAGIAHPNEWIATGLDQQRIDVRGPL